MENRSLNTNVTKYLINPVTDLIRIVVIHKKTHRQVTDRHSFIFMKKTRKINYLPKTCHAILFLQCLHTPNEQLFHHFLCVAR